MKMNQDDKSESDNESSSDNSKSGSSSDSDSESGSASSSSSDGESRRSRRSVSQQPPLLPAANHNQNLTTIAHHNEDQLPPIVSNNQLNLSKSTNESSGSGSDDDDDDDDSDHQPAQAPAKSETDDDEDESDRREEYNTSTKSSPDDDEDYAVKKNVRRKAPVKKAAPAPKKKKNSWNSGTSESDEQSISDSASDDEMPRHPKPKKRAPARKPAAAAKRKNNNNAKAAQHYSSGSDSDDQKRFANRRAGAAVSYKEASEDEKTDSEDLIDVDYDDVPVAVEEVDKSETIERIIQRRFGHPGVTGNTTTTYAIEENGDPNVVEGEDEATREANCIEEQFFIKWKGWSHIHNTWESEASLKEQKVKGMKKLENYIKKEREIEAWRLCAGPEDIDYFECQLELQQDLLKSYNDVDRIIAQTEKIDGGLDYLCKWESLPYGESTWEDASLVQRKWNNKIVEFNSREASKKTPSKHTKVLRYRPKFQRHKEQPDYMGLDRGLKLRDYQMEGLNWLLLTWCKENSVILADEMGLGKTIQTICFLYNMFMEHNLHGPFLCVVPLSTMTAWQREFAIWAPQMNFVTYLGDVQSREMIRQYEWSFDSSKRLKFNAILTTYEIVLKDKAFLGSLSWAALLVDEAHRLKNDDSLLYKALFDFDTNHRLLITGTPLQNSLKELWALLHFIMPKKFETWDEFEKLHGNAEDKGYVKLHKQLEPYILRRVKKDVEKSLPAKVEQILRVEMTSVQKQYYKWILTKNFNALRKGSKGSTSTFLNIVIELKKCTNHAMLIRPLEYEAATTQDDAVQMLLKGSGKLVLLDKLLCRLRETGHRVLIFSQMVRMLDILAEYLQKRHFPFQRLDGSIKGEIRKQALDHFNAEGSPDFCFLLSTRAGGLGINLATADTVIIFDSDWNPQNDLQAQARAHRIGQKNQVNIYRLVTARSVEEDIVERAKRKMVLDHLVIQRMDTTGRMVLDKNSPSTTTPFNKEDLSAILKFGAEELFKDEPEEEGSDLVCDIDEILRRAETRDDAPTMIGDELLSAFKVASFAAFDEDMPIQNHATGKATADDGGDTKDWDELIPERLRKAVEDEERSKELEDLYLPPRRKTLQQINQQNDDKANNRKKKKKQAGSDDDSDAGSDASVDNGLPKKRGRPPVKKKFANFSEQEIRRFIRSYKKFPAPLKRLESIAGDAELTEKPMNEIRKLAECLHERYVTFLEELAKNPPKDEDTSEVKKRGARAGFSVKFLNVSFNAKTLMACEEELKPLDEVMPANGEERSKWMLDIKVRPPNFDVDWSVSEDSKLLRGIYQYGMGSWEAMKMDPSLELVEKILSNENKKPQAKHLQSRAEYLLKVIKKNVDLKKTAPKAKRTRQPKVKSKDIIENDPLSSDDDQKLRIKKENGKIDSTASSSTASPVDDTSSTNNGPAIKKTPKAKSNKEPKKAKSGKKVDGPMHFTANNEPRALNVLGDLDPTIFNECKEKMRPVKKALKALDNPDLTLSEQDQVNNTRACLLSIGKQIDECLLVYKDADKVKEWRSNLWYFVSKFTEFDAKKLFKLYKHAMKRSEDAAGSSSANSSFAKEAADSKAAKTTPKSKHRSPKDASSNLIAAESPLSNTTASDRIAMEKRERKEKRKSQKEKNKKRDRDNSEDDGEINMENGHGNHREDTAKRKLEEGECEPDIIDHKRIHVDRRSRDMEKEDRKKWDTSNSDHRIRRNSGNIPPLLPAPLRGAAPSTPQRMSSSSYADPRPGGGVPGSRSVNNDGIVYNDGERWNQRDRDHKRERYDSGSYSNRNSSPHGYHRERDRDRGERRSEKRSRYQPPSGGGYPSQHFGMAGGVDSAYYASGQEDFSPGYRDRYPISGGGGGGSGGRGATPMEWSRSDRGGYDDYRRGGDYDRRPPPPSS